MNAFRPLLTATLLLMLAVSLMLAPETQAKDWPWWRGPDRNGIADPDQKPPVKFSETESVKWVTPIPGRGHGSAIVVGDRVILQTADEATETQSVICLDRKTGKPRWTTEVPSRWLSQEEQEGLTRVIDAGV